MAKRVEKVEDPDVGTAGATYPTYDPEMIVRLVQGKDRLTRWQMRLEEAIAELTLTDPPPEDVTVLFTASVSGKSYGWRATTVKPPDPRLDECGRGTSAEPY